MCLFLFQFIQQVKWLRQALAAGVALALQDLTKIRQQSLVCQKLMIHSECGISFIVTLSLSLPFTHTHIFYLPFIWNFLLFDSKANELCPVKNESTAPVPCSAHCLCWIMHDFWVRGKDFGCEVRNTQSPQLSWWSPSGFGGVWIQRDCHKQG